jgi:hypothetical protein
MPGLGDVPMNNIKNKPSTPELDPAEGSREIIDRELRRNGLEEDTNERRKGRSFLRGEANRNRRAAAQTLKVKVP